jgi:hypothetical protein
VQGAHFAASEPVSLYLDTTTSTSLTSTTTDDAGTFTASFSVPQAISGTHTLRAVGQSSGLQASARFTILPGTTLLHYQGYKGTQDVLKGAGFAPYETVTGYWQTPSGTPFPITATTNGLGTFGGSSSFPGITFTVPLSPTGQYAVYAVGQTSGGVAHSTFTLKPHLQLTPNSGPAGSQVTVVGTGYGASEGVTLKYNCGTSGCSSTTILATPQTDANGFFRVLVSLPKTTSAGVHALGAIGGTSGVFATATFTITG